ncbi:MULTISPECIES: sensor histidine kinase [Enterococcus]|uniref:sensor histidine kinase n=1 Tax=Enterococcus TaxID=1350 RepID=UPI0022E14487|nr:MULTISPECIES: ATP-binding protein [Enterococcus]
MLNKKREMNEMRRSEMTIRQRLYLSNLLMIIMPIVLTGIVLSGLFFIFSDTFGRNFFHQWQENRIYAKEYDQIEELKTKFDAKPPTEKQMIAEVARIDRQFPRDYISVLVYSKEQKLLHRERPYQEDKIVKNMLADPQQHTLVVNNVLVNRLEVGGFHLLLINQKYHMNLEERLVDNKQKILFVIVLTLACVILFVLLTNYLLSRFIFRPINDALTVLLNGAQQIRDGNLSWRTSYHEEDEFLPVVNSFNEMAERLETMVTEQEKTTENRKELIAGISHDLRTPLTAIKAYVEGLDKGVATTPAMKDKYLRTIASKTDELTHLVEQLFLFSKIDLGEYALKIKTVNIGKYLADVIEGVTDEYAQRGLTIILGARSFQTKAAIDPEQLRNVIMNIIENTLKYGNQTENQLVIEQYEDLDQVILTFSDNGPGVPAEQYEKIFNVFYRGDQARTQTGKGSGLGLAIARRVVESQKGTIEAAPSPSGGLQIRIQLPIRSAENEDKE